MSLFEDAHRFDLPSGGRGEAVTGFVCPHKDGSFLVRFLSEPMTARLWTTREGISALRIACDEALATEDGS